MAKLNSIRFILLPILVWFFYSGLLMHNYGELRNKSDVHSYWGYFAETLLEGKTDIETCPSGSGCHDLVMYKGKIYMYWPPVPALLYMPIVTISGTSTPDYLIVSILGAMNVWLFSLFLFYLSKRYQLNYSFWDNQFWSIFWAFGSVHFFMSMAGSVWYISQIFAQTLLLLGLVFIIKESKRNWEFLFSGVCLALACYTRNNLIFVYFFAFGVFISDFKLKKDSSTVSLLRSQFIKFSVFILPLIIVSILNLYYNYIRFENVFENGLNYHKMDSSYLVFFEKYGFFDFRYMSKNIYAEILQPPIFKFDFPFFELGKHKRGFGILWASPIFILFLIATFLNIKKWYKERVFLKLKSFFLNAKFTMLLTNYLSLIGISLVIFSIMGSGWAQFASRYSLDYQIFLIIPIILYFNTWKQNKWMLLGMFILLSISIYMNYFGARMYHNIDLVKY
jgi:hypothetical protein